jgi:hypothetical protein
MLLGKGFRGSQRGVEHSVSKLGVLGDPPNRICSIDFGVEVVIRMDVE